ncbi:hypothetical protein JG687_00002730, partial [Phytophthora cactorum]
SFSAQSGGSDACIFGGSTSTLRAALENKINIIYLSARFAATNILSVMAQYGISSPVKTPPLIVSNGIPKYQIDRSMWFVYRERIRRSKMSLPNLIRLVRGDTLHDPLPNKALSVSDHLSSWKSYESRGGVKSSQTGSDQRGRQSFRAKRHLHRIVVLH